MLKIRLKRIGQQKKPIYKIILAPTKSKRDGKSFSDLGIYDPTHNFLHFKKFLLYKSLNKGAYPTNTVRHLIRRFLKKN